MSAIFKRMLREDKEIHVSTGKESPMGSFHVPMWGPWLISHLINDPEGRIKRNCKHPHCDLIDYLINNEEEDADP